MKGPGGRQEYVMCMAKGRAGAGCLEKEKDPFLVLQTVAFCCVETSVRGNESFLSVPICSKLFHLRPVEPRGQSPTYFLILGQGPNRKGSSLFLGGFLQWHVGRIEADQAAGSSACTQPNVIAAARAESKALATLAVELFSSLHGSNPQAVERRIEVNRVVGDAERHCAPVNAVSPSRHAPISRLRRFEALQSSTAIRACRPLGAGDNCR